jgi:hypothetical protein
LTFIPVSATLQRRIKSRSREGRRPPDSGWWSECGARGWRLVTAVPGRLWASCLPTLGPAREVLAATGAGTGRSEARRFRCLSREAWPEAEPLGCVSPSGKNRGGTPEGVRAPKGARAASQDAVVTEQRLTAFRFLFLSFFVARMERSEIRGGIKAS